MPERAVYDEPHTFRAALMDSPRMKSARARAAVFAREILQAWSPRTVLDLGCGIGPHLPLLAEKGAAVTGVDSSPWAKTFAWPGTAGQIRSGDARRADLPRKSFDTVWIHQLLEHLTVPDIHRVLREAERLARKGLAVTVAATRRDLGRARERLVEDDPQRVTVRSRDWWLKLFNKLVSVPARIRFTPLAGMLDVRDDEEVHELNVALPLPPVYALLMTKDEGDVIEHVIHEHGRYFDAIFAIDDSADATPDILKAHPSVSYLVREKEVFPVKPPGGAEHLRDHLLKKVQERHGTDGYMVILHGDEVWHDNPNQMIRFAARERAELLRVKLASFFLHASERERFRELENESVPLAERRLWYALPLFTEKRGFKNKPGLHWPFESQQTYPEGIDRKKRFSKMPVVRHLLYMTPEQVARKAKDRVPRRGEDAYHAWVLKTPDLFVENLPKYPGSRLFDGLFGEHEIDYGLTGVKRIR